MTMNRNEKFIITINREIGSGGRTVGRILAERLNVRYYDKAIIQGLTNKFGLNIEEIERLKAQEAKEPSWWEEFNMYYRKLFNISDSTPKPTTAAMFETERMILESLAERESCVIAGRSTFLIFREWKNRVNVFLQASMSHRIERLMNKRGIRYEDAIDIIESVDEGREAYIKKYSDRSRYDTRNYDLIISMDKLSEEDAADIIMEYIKRTEKQD